MRQQLLSLTTAVAMVFAATAANSAVQIVTQSSLTFNPPSVNIVEGDTVRWVWTSASHTVTNGTGAADPNAGTLFDHALNSVNPIFEYVFSTAGAYPYFCRPHESFNMKGTVVVDVPTAVRPPAAASATLHPNVPNPFGGQTEIEFDLSRESRVTVRIYDARGSVVATLLDGVRSDGRQSLWWDGRDSSGAHLPNGIYFCRLDTGTSVLTRKIVLIR
jgi:plastocyanin